MNKSTGRISHLMLARTEQDEETGEWKVDDEEVLKKRCDFVISAFGSHLAAPDVRAAMEPVVKLNRWGPVVDKVLHNTHTHTQMFSKFLPKSCVKQ